MPITQISAQELFRAAYQNRYTWDHQFPGYTANITYKSDDQIVQGKVRLDANIKAEVLEVSDEAAKKAIHGQLWEIGVHRIRRTFEQTHGENTFSYGETDNTGAVEIIMGGKATGDKYQVRKDIVTLVHRHIHGVVVTINTFSVHETGEGYLSHTYDSVYHDPQTGMQKGGRSVFTDEYEKVGNYFILNRRLIITTQDGNEVIQDFIFSNIELLG